MSDDVKPEAAPAADKPEPISFVEFLESAPPAQLTKVSDFWKVKRQGGARWYELNVPELKLYCADPICQGLRVFRVASSEHKFRDDADQSNIFVTYRCSNCRNVTKMFSLHLIFDQEPYESGAGHCYKFGEFPPFGSPTPNRLLKLFGKDAKIFLKGRQCENHALGIGAFGYYRRVVESHKIQILDEIIKVAMKVAPEMVETLEAAKKEHQFLRAIESVKDAIPQSLLINGHNPLTLLHSALSEGLHAQTDEQCLELAHDVRVVLGELVERVGQAMKDEAELNSAISRLMKPKS